MTVRDIIRDIQNGDISKDDAHELMKALLDPRRNPHIPSEKSKFRMKSEITVMERITQ